MNNTSYKSKSLLSVLGVALLTTPIVAACGNDNHKNNVPISATTTSPSPNNGITGKGTNTSPTNPNSSKTNSSTTTSTPKVKEIKKYHTDSGYVPPTKVSGNSTTTKNPIGNNTATSRGDGDGGIINDGTDGNGGKVGVTKNGKIYSPSDAKNSYTPKSTGNAQGYPVSISVPKMGLYHSIMSYGLRGGILDPYPNSVQYYTGSVKPGQVGNSVIASHVTYNGYAKAFYYLNQLNNGDRFTITYSNGAKKTFQVYNKESVNKYRLKYDQRVWGSSSTANVVLLSCDKNSGWMAGHMHRTNNFVVWAKLV